MKYEIKRRRDGDKLSYKKQIVVSEYLFGHCNVLL